MCEYGDESSSVLSNIMSFMVLSHEPLRLRGHFNFSCCHWTDFNQLIFLWRVV